MARIAIQHTAELKGLVQEPTQGSLMVLWFEYMTILSVTALTTEPQELAHPTCVDLMHFLMVSIQC